MINIKKVLIQVFITENQQNQCAKCCKTISVIDRMVEAFPDFRDNVDIQYIEDSSNKSEEKHRELQRPVVIVNDTIFSQGHVPIIKKLSREILELLK